jgi:hypothetical protein
MGQQMITMQDATGVIGSLTQNGRTAWEADVVLTSFVGACAAAEQNESPANAALLALAIASLSPVGPGTYAVTSSGAMRVLYVTQDANCNTQVNETATSGMIRYDSVSGSMIVGSVDVTFPGGDHFSGNFSAPVCGISLSGLTMLGNGACEHPG